MTFVTDADVQIHLPADKLMIEAVPDDRARAYEDAERIVRGRLATVFSSTTINAWVDPDTTPEIIRAITGRLAAANVYRLRYSVDALDDPQFAQVKYNEAMLMLQQIIDGDLEVIDPGTGLPIDDPGLDFDNSYFLPNDSTDPPKFAMSDRY